MAKRKPHSDGHHTSKKQKTAHDAPTSEDVRTSRQLQQLLTFEQNLQRARHGLQSFKLLLDSIVAQDDNKAENLQILLEYLDACEPRVVQDEVPVYLPDIMENWSMATQMNNQNVMSAVAVVLALLLKVMSSSVDLVPRGLPICRTLLLKRQQELIARNLSVEKGKDFVVSPTLRLLREVICLDGGALAAPVFRARANTFKSLARNMGLRYLGEGIEDPKRPSVRTNAIRFLLSSLTLLHAEAKKDLLHQKDIVAALMRHLRDDPPALIYEILDVLKTSVVKDKKLPKDAKIKILNAHSLTRISTLYGYARDVDEDTETGKPSVEDAAHEMLLAACTDSAAGICRSEQAYYPEGVELDAFVPNLNGANRLDFGLDSIFWISKFENDIPVRNLLLAEFISSLKPWASTKSTELLLAIFKNSPELVAHYFLHKRTFTFDPKLSATWMGFAALLYNVIQLPIPPYFGMESDYATVPPPTSIVLDNIVPAPVTLKAITRCLKNDSKLVSYYAMRLLVLALQKLNIALEMHREASSSLDSVWEEAARRLVDNFCQRTPDIKDVVSCYRALSPDAFLQREAASRLILLYYEVIPQSALSAKIDVSGPLLATIKRLETSDEAGENLAMVSLELEHLCAIAKYSPSMRWFTPPPEMASSPFISLLQLHTTNTTALSGDTLNQVLTYVAEENLLVEVQSASSSLNSLITALRNTGELHSSIWGFLDNCAERCARSPIKYLEMTEEGIDKTNTDGTDTAPVSPLLMAIAEQLPFFMSSLPEKDVLKRLVTFLREYVNRSLEGGVTQAFLNFIMSSFKVSLGDDKLAAKITIAKRTKAPVEFKDSSGQETSTNLNSSSNKRNSSIARMSSQELEDRLAMPVLTSKENVLVRWSSKPAEELVEEGYATSLVLLLSSEHSSIRKEALTHVVKMATKIKESTYEENEQIWLLLMELAESAKDLIHDSPLPSVIVVFACKSLEVLKNPLHCLYEKINLFLTGGPVWKPDYIPLMQAILDDGPTVDGTNYTELSWLLTFLLDSLRTPQDVKLFHQRKVFERIIALPTNPYMGPNLRTQVLRILYRTTSIEGGSDTIITRFGCASWLAAQKTTAVDDIERQLYQAMMTRLWETCDQERMITWSHGGIEKLLEIPQ
ncbi:ribosome 60S biogenesis N-terminal-domain-containing protein [Xylariaceae sp. FL1272]|nr:ribosome 60S biogenesis N-terminal-domain-containing protein [Xylariaceae sp. FL1272]